MAGIGVKELEELKMFIEMCRLNPDILHKPELSFFKDYVESLGATIPTAAKKTAWESHQTKAPEPEPEHVSVESEESDIDVDNEGVIDDEQDVIQPMGDDSKMATEEEHSQAMEKRSEAQVFMADNNIEEAIKCLTEAIELDPHSAPLFAKRASMYVRLNKPSAAIRDCDRAIEINSDSFMAYKWRGRAYRLKGEWERAADDLCIANRLDCDEEAIAWLKEVQPNSIKIKDHKHRREMKKKDKEDKEKRERIRRAREEKDREETRHSSGDGMPHGFPGMGGMPGGMGGMPGGMGGMPGMAGMGGMPGGMDFTKLFSDPELMEAFNDQEIAAAFQDVSQNPANMAKYQSNPKIMNVLTKLAEKMGFSGGVGADQTKPKPPPPSSEDVD
ncbi:hsc70-interacting protein-like [Tubulanus polymorphus]|uniref:hsc70-interacting protein-like n=1 Tax=Tubulanus polymorphus TaxID=672921 RepID=UPI003DA2C3F0